VSLAIDAVAADARFAPLLDFKRVGMFGMSAGGFTALVLAGGQWSLSRLAEHCTAHLREDFAGCTGLPIVLTGGMFDGVKLWLARGWYWLQRMRRGSGDPATLEHWNDPRIAAVVAAVPLATVFDMSTLAHPRVPLGLVRAGRDAWLPPQWHIDAVRAACKDCALIADMPEAGHGSILAPFPPSALPENVARLMGAPNFDRGVLPGVYAGIARFFVENLSP
jgi:predicted dienelactone hydrolase